MPDDLMEMQNDPMEIQYNESSNSLEITNHFHSSDEIIYVLEGKAEFKINNKLYSVGKGHILFISNLEKHELKVLEYPYKRYFILIKPDFMQLMANQPILASIFKQRPEHFQHAIHLDEAHDAIVMDVLKKMHTEYLTKEAFWESLLGTHLNYLFILLYRNYKEHFPLSTVNRSTRRILDIQRYVELHYTEELSLDEVSKLFYSDMFYTSRLFKKITGFTFKDYIIRLRIARAKELLYHTLDDITTVSLNSGFNNVNHFIRIFKKFEGITPYQFRKMREK